jgi:hypothetical protein
MKAHVFLKEQPKFSPAIKRSLRDNKNTNAPCKFNSATARKRRMGKLTSGIGMGDM